MSKFKELSVIDCSDVIEQKGKLSYISWASAWQMLCEKCPDATYEHHDPVTFPNGEMMVSCTVTVDGVSHRMHLPVIDNRNKPIQNPNVFDINTSMQRCFAKAISMHGLGLYIYRGEDLPPAEEVDVTAMYEDFMRRYSENKHNCAVWYSQLTEEEMSAVKDGSPKNKKTATHSLAREIVAEMHANFDEYAEHLTVAVQKEDVTAAAQLWNELESYERQCVFERLEQDARNGFNDLINRAKALREQDNG